LIEVARWSWFLSIKAKKPIWSKRMSSRVERRQQLNQGLTATSSGFMSQSPIEGFEQVESLDLDDGDEYEEEEVKLLLA
jgi:hypothetical protein